MLKPEKWQATFDSDGKNFCFQKALKLIVLGVCFFTVEYNLGLICREFFFILFQFIFSYFIINCLLMLYFLINLLYT